VPKSSALSIVSSFEGYAPFGPISSRSAEQRTRSSTCPLPTAPPRSDPSDGGVAFDRRERGWGVAAALDGGRAELLVPPAELEPLVGPSYSSPKTKFCEQRVARLIDRFSPLAKKPSLRHRTRVVNIGTATRMRSEGESVQRYRRLASTIAVFPVEQSCLFLPRYGFTS
jgi:hypothetical protein